MKFVTELATKLPFASRLIVLAVTLTCGSESFADNIFVAQSRSPSDDNVGSWHQPLETIAEAVSRAEAGDRVIVLSGDYRNEDSGFGRGVIPVFKDGTKADPIFIIGIGSPTLGRVFVSNSSHIRISGFRIIGSDYFMNDEWTPMPAIVRDVPANAGPAIDYFGDWEDRKEAVETAFATYFSTIQDLDYSSGIDIESSDNITIVHNSIVGFWAGIQCRGVAQSQISLNRISYCVNGIFTWEPKPSLVDSAIAFNYITQSLDNGIFVRCNSRNVSIFSNIVKYSGRSHIALNEGAKDCLILLNNTQYGGFYSETMEYPGSSAISINGGQTGNRIIANFAYRQIDLTGIDGNGMILDFMEDGAETWVIGNSSYYNMGAGLNLTASPNSLIANNRFAFNGHQSSARKTGGGIKLSRDQDINNRITRNTFFHNSEGGIIAFDTLGLQQNINLNRYVTQFPIPLASDSFNDNEADYKSLKSLQEATGWESSGKATIHGK